MRRRSCSRSWTRRAHHQELYGRINRKERQLRARKGVTTRLKRKLSNGRCPCCSRQFKDLERHMQEQHPKWDPDKHAAALEAKKCLDIDGSASPVTRWTSSAFASAA